MIDTYLELQRKRDKLTKEELRNWQTITKLGSSIISISNREFPGDYPTELLFHLGQFEDKLLKKYGYK